MVATGDNTRSSSIAQTAQPPNYLLASQSNRTFKQRHNCCPNKQTTTTSKPNSSNQLLPIPTKSKRKTTSAEWGSQTLRQACYRENPESAMCVQNLNDSRGLAIRITYRISLRSSSLWEPRHPPLKVVLSIRLQRGQHECPTVKLRAHGITLSLQVIRFRPVNLVKKGVQRQTHPKSWTAGVSSGRQI